MAQPTKVDRDPREAPSTILLPVALCGTVGALGFFYFRTHSVEAFVAALEVKPEALAAVALMLVAPVVVLGGLDWARARRRDFEPPTVRVQVARSLAFGVALALANVLVFVALRPSLLELFLAVGRRAAVLAVLVLPYALAVWTICFRRRTFIAPDLPSFREACAALRETNDFILGRAGSEWKTGGGDPSWFVMPEKAMFTNLYGLGGIGSGKTSAIVYPLLEQALFKWASDARRKIGIFLLDAKGDNAAYVLERARHLGREKDVIVITPGGPYSYNPIGWGSATAIANKLVAALEVMTEQQSNSYYKKMQREFAENAFEVLPAVLGAGKVGMEDLYEFICTPAIQKQYLDAAASGNSRAFRWFQTQWLAEKPEEQRQLIKGFRADLSSFVREDMVGTFGTARATFPGWESIIEEGKIVVFSMSLDEYGEFARAMGIFALLDFENVMLRRSTTRFRESGGNVDRLVLCFIDEVWAYMNPRLAEFTAVSRQAKCCTLALHQSLAQVDEKYRQVILGNFRTPIVLGVNDLLSLETFSRLFGSHKVVKRSRSESAGYSGVERQLLSDAFTARMGGESRNLSVSETEVDEPRFSPDDILHLPQNRAIVQMFDGATTHDPRVVETLRIFEQNADGTFPYRLG
jgi:hypothetical protein